MTDGVHGSGGEDGLKLSFGDGAFIRGFLGTHQVHDCAIGSTDDHVDSGDKPRVREVVEDHLVLEIESDVKSVPECER